MLKRLWQMITEWLRPVRPPVKASEPEPVEPEPRPSRSTRRAMDAQRRKFERQRRKFDKFVTPQGVKPISPERGEAHKPSQPHVAEPAQQVSRDLSIVDVHHSDRKTKVLYEERELYGEFNFRDTILDQLDRYFVYLDRMKKHDADAYGFYRQIGAQLLPYVAIPDIWELEHKPDPDAYVVGKHLSPWFLQTRPSFGCIAYGANPEMEKLENNELKKYTVPRFLYFVKYTKPPPEVQAMSGGDIYKLTVWWDMAYDKRIKHGVPEEIAFFVGHDGKVCLLKLLDTKMYPIRSKRGDFHIPQRAWRIPDAYKRWAKRHGTTVHKFMSSLFIDTADKLEWSSYSMIKVSVEKKDRYAVFSIDPQRLPYFFQDRDYSLTASGARKRIFHMVKPHERADGSIVKLHGRGEQDFSWAGYNVRITIPGIDHVNFSDFDPGVIDGYWREKGKKYVTEPELGARIRRMMNAATGANR